MRRSALDRLERAGCTGHHVRLAKIPERFASSVDFAIELMEKTGVIVVPGSAFGAQGEGYVRMALVVPPERMAEAVRRIDESGIVKE